MSRCFLLLLLLLLTSCAKDEIFSDFRSFPDAEWNKQKAMRFEATVREISIPYDLIIELRHNNQYPFRNIWLYVECQTPSGSLQTDTMGGILADSYGKWYGKGLSLYSYSLKYQENVQYPDSGTYVYTIRHGMRSDMLKGVSDIGLRISKK
jgi:gliding motility-associated lipoprotein GldH